MRDLLNRLEEKKASWRDMSGAEMRDWNKKVRLFMAKESKSLERAINKELKPDGCAVSIEYDSGASNALEPMYEIVICSGERMGWLAYTGKDTSRKENIQYVAMDGYHAYKWVVDAVVANARKVINKREGIGEAQAEPGWKKPINKRTVKAALNGLDIEYQLSGTNFGTELEVDEKDEPAVQKALKKYFGHFWGGFQAGYGGWVLRPEYKSKGDWGDKSSAHHY